MTKLSALLALLTVAGSTDREPEPYANPGASNRCEAYAAEVSPCADIMTEHCPGYWEAYDVCMVAAESSR